MVESFGPRGCLRNIAGGISREKHSRLPDCLFCACAVDAARTRGSTPNVSLSLFSSASSLAPRAPSHRASPSSRVLLRRVGCRCFGIGWLGFCVGGVAGSPSSLGPRWRRHREEEEGGLASRLPQKESRARFSLSLFLFPPRKPSPARHASAYPERRREASGSSSHLRLAGGDGDDDWCISFVWNDVVGVRISCQPVMYTG
ncbi:unnamed protein product [Ixodes pacificus]